MSSLLRSIIMSTSYIYAIFFITLLIDYPTNIRGDPLGNLFECSDGLKDTLDTDVLEGVITYSGSDITTPRAIILAYELVVLVKRDDYKDP